MSFEDRHVLVTGGAGFIGSNLVERLLEEGARVRVLDNFATGSRENLRGLTGPLEVVEGSVTDPGACASACVGVDFVLHQAALPSVQRSVSDPRPTHEVSSTGTLNLLHAAATAGVKRLVYAGSSSAYGDTTELPKREDMPCRPRSPYAVAKLSGEHYAQVFPRLFGLETVVLRYFNIFGPRQDPGSPYSAAIPLFAAAALRGKPPTINGDGGQTRDFTYVDNAVAANFLACSAPADGVVGEVFNVACGSRVSIMELWQQIRSVVGSDVEPNRAPPRAGDVRDSMADLSKIRERLGYEVRVGLEEGLRRTVDWLRKEAGGSEADPSAS